MPLIVAGSRSVSDSDLVADAVTRSGWTRTVVEGEAPRIDRLAREWV